MPHLPKLALFHFFLRLCALGLFLQGLCYTNLFSHANELNANSLQVRFWKAIVTFISLYVFTLRETIISVVFFLLHFLLHFVVPLCISGLRTNYTSEPATVLLALSINPHPPSFFFNFNLNMECNIRIIHLCILTL